MGPLLVRGLHARLQEDTRAGATLILPRRNLPDPSPLRSVGDTLPNVNRLHPYGDLEPRSFSDGLRRLCAETEFPKIEDTASFVRYLAVD